MITTPDSFIAEIKIANAEVTPTNTVVSEFITKYEPRFLNELFGVSFANLFVAGLAADPVDARWTDLLTPDLELAIANYIYVYYQDYKNQDASGTGQVKSKDTNAVTVDPGDPLCRAWNEMVDICYTIIPLDADVYPEYVIPEWLKGFEIFPSSYRGFIPCVKPNIFSKINKYGI